MKDRKDIAVVLGANVLVLPDAASRANGSGIVKQVALVPWGGIRALVEHGRADGDEEHWSAWVPSDRLEVLNPPEK